MCFTPKVSISTATFEFITALFIFFRYGKQQVSKSLAIFVTFLGMYQFSEFMLCTTQNQSLWGIVGFISYTFLPPLGIYFVLKYSNKKISNLIYFLFLPAIVFSLLAIFTDNFIIQGTCSTVFVILRTAFTQLDTHFFTTLIYFIYYSLYIIAITIILICKTISEKNNIRKKIYSIILIADLCSLVPALILTIVLPSFKIMFPSIYCHFAILFAILALVAAHLDKKYLHNK